jgi:hypothetical protein
MGAVGSICGPAKAAPIAHVNFGLRFGFNVEGIVSFMPAFSERVSRRAQPRASGGSVAYFATVAVEFELQLL